MNSIVRPFRRHLFILFSVLILVLAGCGGGDGSSGPTAVTISSQPTDQSTVTGSSVTFNVTASGDGIAYQWQQSTNSDTTWNNISGATSASYRISSVTAGLNGEKIRVVVTGTANTVTSSAVTLTVGAAAAPAITVQPTPQSATAGTNATFTVTATGTTLIYQWQASTNGGTTWTDISGQTKATLALSAVVTADNGKLVRVNVSNSLNAVTSSAVALTVNAASAAPAFTTQPAAASVVAAATATFSAAATGTPAPTYQWQLSTNSGATFTNISGATSASYTTSTTTTADSGRQFRVIATNSVSTATSSTATLTVTAAAAPPAITTQPISVSVTAPATVTFTVVATGTPTPTYQWQVSTDGGITFINITGATSPSYTIAQTAVGDNSKKYRVLVSNSSDTAISSSVNLLVSANTNRFNADISASSGYVVARKSDGTLVAWGSNLNLSGVGGGNGSTPTVVPGVSGIVDVSVSIGTLADKGSFTLVRTAFGNILGWGLTNSEEMPLGVYSNVEIDPLVEGTPIASPTLVTQLNGVVQARAVRESNGRGVSIGRKADGTVYMLAGSLDSTQAAVGAKAIDGLSGITHIGYGTNGMVPFIDLNGNLWIVSNLVSPIVGLPLSQAIVSAVTGLPAVVDASCYSSVVAYVCVALDTNQEVWTWGNSSGYGQIGDGTRIARTTPAKVAGLGNIVKVAVSGTNTYAVRSDGALYGWGGARRMATTPFTPYTFDSGNVQDSLLPALLSTVSNVRDISVSLGSGSTGTVLIVKTDGSVWGWGANPKKELAGGTEALFSYVPLLIPGINLDN
jgi:hypothetical protein